MTFDGRAFIVTGGAGAIGQATTRLLHARGASVALADLDEQGAQIAAEQVDRTGERAVGFGCDVTSARGVNRMVDAVIDQFERVDGIVNGAGMIEMGESWEASPEDWNRHAAVNVTGVFNCCQAVGRRLRQDRGGAIVNVSSNCGKVGFPNMAAYNASKAAVISLTRSLAQEWASAGINVNAVCPGGVETPMLMQVADWVAHHTGRTSTEVFADMGPAQLGRRVRADEVARVIAFLLSDDAAIIRGQSINVDAGDTPY